MTRFFDLDHLNTLVVIAETGSLSAAAPRLCRSQSAVSEQVRKLEEACGASLFRRGKLGTTLTPAGERLLGHARQLLACSDAAYRDMHGAQLAGDLRLAITDYFRPMALPGILRRARDQFPHLHLHVSIRKSAFIEETAAEGEFDIGLSMTILDGDGRSRIEGMGGHLELRHEPLSWVAAKSFTQQEDRPLPLVALPDSCSLQRFVLRTLEKHRIPYTIAHSASGIGGLHLALAAGLGVACLNASAIPEGVFSFAGHRALPLLPDVVFSLVPALPGERPVIAEVRQMLVEQLS